jgi:hypothetical protein
MKIKTFNRFNESISDIDSICKEYGIKNYTIDNGLVNVDGDVDLSSKKLTKIPVKFGTVNGDIEGGFECGDNQLTSLEGSPHIVYGNFYCGYNQLTSLEGSPKEVHGDFSCSVNNQLISLKGAPELIEGGFYCRDTPVYSIFQSTDPGLIGIFNMIFSDNIDLPLIEYWFSIIKVPLTDKILSNIKKYYPNI